MTVADVGAGTGLFTRLFSPLVGSEGHVFAVDYSTLLVAHLVETARALPLKNVNVVRCSPDSINLPRGSVDLAFLCDTYRYFREPKKSMRSVRRALRRNGAVVVIDSQRVEASEATGPDGAPPLPVKAPSELIDEIESVGFRLVGTETFLLESYFLRFEKVTHDESSDSNE
jgi:SAM-dependent methyltransferase